MSLLTGSMKLPPLRIVCSPSGSAMAAATSPVTNTTAKVTTALAARTRPRRGTAVIVTRIRPRRYSAVMNMVATTTTAISPANVPTSVCAMSLPPALAEPGTSVAMSPDPVTVILPPAC